ncbi:hypothetical protein CPAV1605_1240 [seawater metagenome]|uniref:4a-hydroxytetrahydrobiopterin dehydratase n=1 Tax=seawater metagenome TaxID=1561972 RepID=A0A5E8CL21_9ZZZZ
MKNMKQVQTLRENFMNKNQNVNLKLNNNNQLELNLTNIKFENICKLLEKINPVIIALDHHPEIIYSYNFITIKSTTHEKDNTITQKDFDLIESIFYIYFNLCRENL